MPVFGSSPNIGQPIDAMPRRHLPGKQSAVGLAALIYLRWLDFQDAEQEAIAAFEGRDYQPVMPEKARWRNWPAPEQTELGPFLSEVVEEAVDHCRTLDKTVRLVVLDGLRAFRREAEWAVPEESWRIETAVKWLKALPFESPRDRRRLLTAFDAALAQTDNRLDPMQRTPADLARLLAALAAPEAGERVYDPSFGSAGLLTALVDRLRDQGPGNRPVAGALDVTGAELDPQAFLIGLARLVLAGIESPALVLGNALERLPPDQATAAGADLVVANPPIGQRVEPKGLGHLPIPSKDSTGLFLQHVIGQLNPRGRAVILVPKSYLFRRGQEARVREYLIRQHGVEAVIWLPPGALGPGVMVQAAILVLRKEHANRIRMIDAESLLKAKGLRTKEGFDPAAIAAIVAAMHGPLASEHAWDVDAAGLAGVDWDLTPQRRDLSSLNRSLDALPEGTERCALGDLAEAVSGTSVPTAALALASDRSERHAIPYLRIGDLQRGRIGPPTGWIDREAAGTGYRLRAGDILLSKSGTIGKIAVVGEREMGAMAASGFYVLRADRGRIDSRFLAAYLQSDACRGWLQDRATSGAISHLSIRTIRDLPVPVPAIPIQEQVARAFGDHGEDAMAALLRILEASSDDQDTTAVREWIGQMLERLPELPENLVGTASELGLIDDWLQERPPIRRCGTCGKPYSALDIRRHPEHAAPPDDDARGVVTTCLSCHLGLATEDDACNRPSGGLLDWAVAFDDAIRPLSGIGSVPWGPALLALIQDGRRRLAGLKAPITAEADDGRAAARMNERVDGLLSFAERAIFSDVAVKLEPTCGDMVTDGPDDLAVTVINRGSLPLREVHVTGALGRAADEVIHYLAERGRASITFKNFIDPAFSGRCEVDLQWTALTLQGKDVRGTERLVFEVVQPGPSATEQADLGSSPYICASPVDPQRDDVFFGREQELGQIRRQVATSANVVLLEGNRRAGKTSILKHLEGRDAVPGWLGVYCSLQDAPGSEEGAGVPTVEVFRLMARELAKAVHRLGLDTPLPDGTELAASRKPLGVAKACRAGIGTDGPFSDLAEYLDLLLALLAPLGLGILLLLDEFDKLQEGIDSGVTSPQVPENIRFLVQNHPRFSAVLTGSRRLKRLREEYWSALFGLGTRIGVSALPQAAARRLVTEPVQGRLKYSDAAVDRAIELTGAQPFLLQNLCNRIFDLVAREIPGVESSSALRSRSVTPEVVERAAVELVQDNEHFAALWGYAGSHRRRFILALCRREQEARGPIRLGELGELLAVEGVPTPDEALDADLDHLRELELLELTGRGEYGRYRLAVPLMGLWVGNQQDFDSLRVKARFETEDEHG